MQDDVTYNQIIIVKKNAFIKCQLIKKSFTEKGKLIIVFEDSQKITIDGKSIETSCNKKRILEPVSMAEEREFDIPKKSVMHYVKGGDSE